MDWTVLVLQMSVSMSVCLSRRKTRRRCAKTVEQITTEFGLNTRGEGNIVFEGDLDPPHGERGRVLRTHSLHI